MRQFKLLGAALMALLALTAALSASAFALETPVNLPEAAVTRNWTGSAIGKTELHAEGQANPVVCTAAKAEGTETASNPPKGAFHITFENCTTASGGITVKCTGLGDATGIILALGTWSLVFDKLIGKPFENLTSAILFVNEVTHFTCGGLVLLLVLAPSGGVGGETLCLHLTVTKAFTHEFHCIGEGLGGVKVKPIEEYGTDKALGESKGKVPVLLTSINGGTAVPFLRLWLGTVTFGVEVEGMV